MATNFWRVKKGINFEAWTDLNLVPLPDEADLAYESNTHKFKYYNGTIWKELGAGSGINNYIASYDGNTTTGWKMYKDAAGVLPVDATGGSACTFDDATDTVNHAFGTIANNTPVTFLTISTTTGIVVNTTYYVVNTASGSFQVALTVGGAALPLTNNGSGTMVYGAAMIVSTSSPLRSPANFLFIKSAVNYQGLGIAYDITIDSADTNDFLYLEFDYDFTDSNYVDDEIVPFVIDLTSSAVTALPGIKGIKGKYNAQFATGANTTYRIGFHIAGTNATAYTALKIDSVVVSQSLKDRTDWKLLVVDAAGNAVFAGGLMKLQNGQYLSTNATSTNLSFALPSTPTANHTYYAYVDLYLLGSQIAVNGMVAKDASSAIVLFDGGLSNSTTRTNSPEQINASRYVHVATFFPTTTSWANCQFISNNGETKNMVSGIFGAPESGLKTIAFGDALSGIWTHNLSGEPQTVTAYFYDLSLLKKYALDVASYITDKNSTTVSYDFTGMTLVSGDYIEIRAIHVPVSGSQYVGTSNRFESSWITSVLGASPYTMPHGLSDIDDIRSYCVIEWNTTTGRRTLVNPDSLIQDFDTTNFYLDFTSVTPTSTLQYKIVSGGTPLPSAWKNNVDTGYSKVVGGFGAYSTLAAALAASADGDSILVTTPQTLTGAISCSLNNIEIKFMPGATVTTTTYGFTFAGSNVKISNMKLIVTDDLTTAFSITSDDSFFEAFINMNGSGKTLGTAFLVNSGGDRNWINASVKTTLGTVTTKFTDSGTDNDIAVR